MRGSASAVRTNHKWTRYVVCVVLAFAGRTAGVANLAGAADWPTYQHDNLRSAVTSEELALSSLTQTWVHVSRHAPQPAWEGGPAKQDFWHSHYDLSPRITYDRAFHVSGVGQSVYFGSSADDKVYCLDAETGRERWTFFTGGPVRFAPTVSDGRVYVGSDDGSVYCLDATRGTRLWTYSPAPRTDRILGNGRVISRWPVRTGVLVDGGIAYFCAGLFPKEAVYVCAVDAATGAAAGTNLWKETRSDLTPEGYLLASAARLYVPTGRTYPVVFSRTNGAHLGAFSAAGTRGGTYALLTGDVFVGGPGNVRKLEAFDVASKDQIATFDGLHMIVTPTISYLHTGTQLRALDRACFFSVLREKKALSDRQAEIAKRLEKVGKKADSEEAKKLRSDLADVKEALAEIPPKLQDCILWVQPCPYVYSLILAGDVLFAGGDDEVAGIATADGATRWTGPVTGRAYGLAVANGRLFVSTDRGIIHCFSQGSASAASWKRYGP